MDFIDDISISSIPLDVKVIKKDDQYVSTGRFH